LGHGSTRGYSRPCSHFAEFYKEVTAPTRRQTSAGVRAGAGRAGRADVYDVLRLPSDGAHGMSNDIPSERVLERILADLLSTGAWLGSAAIATGLILRCMGWGKVMSPLTCVHTISVGIALFIFLPILRVLLMAVAFVRMRDVMLSVLAIVVLAVIGAAAFMGMRIG
jgi:uncharacterized membrane protein